MTAIRITALSLNIWNYRGGWAARRERIVRVIREDAPDVVALQEVRRDPRYTFGVNQAVQLARRTGLHHLYAPAMRYWRFPRIEEGLAILTPHRIVQHTVVPLRWDSCDPFDPNRRIALHVTLALPDGTPFDCWVTHLNQHAPLRDASAIAVRDALQASSPPLPALLMGDCNAKPASTTIRELRATGLRDMWLTAHPDDPGFTYPAELPTGRIDYLFAQPGWEIERIARVGVGSRALSDHCGLRATLILP